MKKGFTATEFLQAKSQSSEKQYQYYVSKKKANYESCKGIMIYNLIYCLLWQLITTYISTLK